MQRLWIKIFLSAFLASGVIHPLQEAEIYQLTSLGHTARLTTLGTDNFFEYVCQMQMNGETAYCIEPEVIVTFSKGVGPQYTPGSYEEVPLDLRWKLKEIAYYGYGYAGENNTVEDYTATQLLIWKLLAPAYYESDLQYYSMCPIVTQASLSCGVGKKDVEERMVQIENRIQENQILPSFALDETAEYELSLEKDLEFVDANVLKFFSDQPEVAVNGITTTQEDGKLTIHLDPSYYATKHESKVTLTFRSTTYSSIETGLIAYRCPDTQSIYVDDGIQPIRSYSIQLTIPEVQTQVDCSIVSDPITDAENPTIVDWGSEIHYVFAATNTGPISTNLSVKEALPTFTSLRNSDGMYSFDTHTVEWNFENLQPGETRTAFIEVVVKDEAPDETNLVAVVTVGIEGGSESTLPSVVHRTSRSSCSQDACDPNTMPVLFVSQESQAPPSAIPRGSPLTYLLTLTNVGTFRNKYAVIEDRLPDGFTLTGVDWNPRESSVEVLPMEDRTSWVIKNLGPSESITFRLSGTVELDTSVEELVNQVRYIQVGSDPLKEELDDDAWEWNSIDSITHTLIPPNVTISQTSDPGGGTCLEDATLVIPGERVIYQMEIENIESQALCNEIQIRDELPTELIYVHSDLPEGITLNHSGNTLLFTCTDLKPSEKRILTLEVEVSKDVSSGTILTHEVEGYYGVSKDQLHETNIPSIIHVVRMKDPPLLTGGTGNNRLYSVAGGILLLLGMWILGKNRKRW